MTDRESPLGLARGTVELRAYHPDWPKMYELEAARLRKLMGRDVIDIEHIGSTAIPGMPAKPILDIMAAVPSLDCALTHQSALEEAGYERRINGDLEDRRFFAKGPRTCRTHHLSLTLLGSSYWVNQIAFRDELVANPELAKKYAELKQYLSRRHLKDRKAYTEAKAALVREVLAVAQGRC